MLNSGDNNEFTKTIQIANYECDTKNKIRLGFILRHIQEVSSEHLDELGLTYTVLLARGQAFLLCKLDLQIERRPEARESIRLITAPKQPVGAQFLRTTLFLDDSGGCLLRADTAWLLVNPQTRRICRPHEFAAPFEMPFDERAAQFTKYRPAVVKETERIGSREVRPSDLDVNDHMNNAIYADIMEDYLPLSSQPGHSGRDINFQGMEVERFYLHYQNEARLGDVLEIFRSKQGDGSWFVQGKKQQAKCFEAVVWPKRMEDKA